MGMCSPSRPLASRKSSNTSAVAVNSHSELDPQQDEQNHRDLPKYPAYRYSTLPTPSTIRLLVLQACKNSSDALVGRICYAEVPSDEQESSAAEQYVALSYCWGDSNTLESMVILDPRKPNETFCLRVTRNLHAALCRLRGTRVEDEQLVWADAVCINQEDTDEKVAQISLMPRIYHSSTKAVIFLGDVFDTPAVEIDESVDVLLALIALVNERIPEMRRDDETFNVYRHHLLTMDIFFAVPSAEESMRRWWAIIRLYQRPWFFRVWILQELIRSREAAVMWAHRSFDWIDVFTAAQIIHMASNNQYQPLDIRDTGIDRVLFMGSWKQNLSLDDSATHPLGAMMLTRNFNATVDVDKFNAVLNLLGGRKTELKPTYERTAAELFCDVACHHIVAIDSPMFPLSCVDGAPQEKRLSIPSWVTDWSQVGSPKSWFNSEGGIFNACGSSTEPIVSLDHATASKLSVAGKIMDFVVEVSQPYIPPVRDLTAYSNGAELALEMHSRMQACLEEYSYIYARHMRFPVQEGQEQQSTADGQPVDEETQPAGDFTFWRALTCNLNLAGEPLTTDRSVLDPMIIAFVTYYDEPLGTFDDNMEIRLLAGQFESLMKHWSMVDRVFVATANGRFGWAPKWTMPGDEVAILAGGKIPFIVRNAHQEERYALAMKQFEAQQHAQNVQSSEQGTSQVQGQEQHLQTEGSKTEADAPEGNSQVQGQEQHVQAEGNKTEAEVANDRRLSEFRILGECYIHGIMDGPAFDAHPVPLGEIILV